MEKRNEKTRLTKREREILIGAIAAKASGSPCEASQQVLAAVAVLRGEHPPILVWPSGISREEMAAWHEGEAAYWRESAARHTAPITQSAAQDSTSCQTDGSTALAGMTPPRSA